MCAGEGGQHHGSLTGGARPGGRAKAHTESATHVHLGIKAGQQEWAHGALTLSELTELFPESQERAGAKLSGVGP